MRRNVMVLLFALVFIFGCFVTFLQTAEAQVSSTKVGLSGIGSEADFTQSVYEWTNVIYLGDVTEYGANPTIWYLIYTGNVNEVFAMTVTFSTENGHDGLLWDTLYDELSENPATGQTGWVIVTPFNWNIIYGLSTIELTPNSGPVGAFISEAKHQGVGPKFVVPEYALGGFAACLSCFAALGAFYVSKNRVKTNSVTTNALI